MSKERTDPDDPGSAPWTGVHTTSTLLAQLPMTPGTSDDGISMPSQGLRMTAWCGRISTVTAARTSPRREMDSGNLRWPGSRGAVRPGDRRSGPIIRDRDSGRATHRRSRVPGRTNRRDRGPHRRARHGTCGHGPGAGVEHGEGSGGRFAHLVRRPRVTPAKGRARQVGPVRGRRPILIAPRSARGERRRNHSPMASARLSASLTSLLQVTDTVNPRSRSRSTAAARLGRQAGQLDARRTVRLVAPGAASRSPSLRRSWQQALVRAHAESGSNPDPVGESMASATVTAPRHWAVRDKIPAGPLIEPQRGGVVVSGDEREPSPTRAPRLYSGGIQQQGLDTPPRLHASTVTDHAHRLPGAVIDDRVLADGRQRRALVLELGDHRRGGRLATAADERRLVRRRAPGSRRSRKAST